MGARAGESLHVYLDACCLSRLTDDHSNVRVRTEASAVARVLALARIGTLKLVSSEALQEEVRRNPSREKRVHAQWVLSMASKTLEVDPAIAQRAREFVVSGYSTFDGLHLAVAESANSDVLLTTDDRSKEGYETPWRTTNISK